MKKIVLILFVLVAIIQLAIPVNMILSREDVLNSGKAYKFRTMPIDPTDIFKGKYISLNFTNNIVKFKDSLAAYEFDVYVAIDINSAGFAEIRNVYIDKPEVDYDYFAAKAYRIYDNEEEQMIRITFPFNRFYMEESKAKPAENLYNKTRNDTTQTAYALVYIKNGRAVLKDVMINDISIRLLVMEEKEE
jgi:uncharacterized membrane-anchored protein